MPIALLLFAAAPLLEYRVTASANAETLDVEVRGDAGVLTLDTSQYLTVVSDGGAVFRYRYRLGDAARELNTRKYAFADGDGLYASPSTWLVHPEGHDDETFSLQLSLPKGTRFVTGLHTGPRPDTYVGPIWALNDSPWGGFAAFDTVTETLGGAQVEIAIAPGELALTHDEVRTWVRRSVALVSSYYGAFPVGRVAIMVLPKPGMGVGFGTAMGNGGAAVLVWLGKASDLEMLLQHDWVLPHELIHFALPNLPPRHTWLEEGTATYVEPVTRTRAGEMSVDDFWRQMIEKLPQGLPEKGDRGLDRTPTWGRTYWGGALFCFLADVELRKKGKSLDAALKGVVAAGGTQETKWDLARVWKAGDAATGTTVLATLHAQLGDKPGTVNLDAVFKQLGVSISAGKIVYDDKAPLAAVRKAMTAK